jgi:tetratricopeptide (TPR) repeat protein
MFDQTLPPIMVELHRIPVAYADGEGIDFEPLPQQFESADENTRWLRGWLKNNSVDGLEYRVFGHDGSGGQAAFWLARKDVTIVEQPVVFFGSEGALGVVARDFADYLWLLAAGVGPKEAIEHGIRADLSRAHELARSFGKFAADVVPEARKSPHQIVGQATSEFPNFGAGVLALAGKDKPKKTKVPDNTWESLLAESFDAHSDGDMDTALAGYTKVIALAPWSPHAYVNTGNIHWTRSNDFKEAIRCYDQALSLAPDHVHGLRNRAEALLRVGQPEAAERDLLRVLKLSPHDALAYFLLAVRFSAQQPAPSMISTKTATKSAAAAAARALDFARKGKRLDPRFQTLDHPPYVALVKELLKPQ